MWSISQEALNVLHFDLVLIYSYSIVVVETMCIHISIWVNEVFGKIRECVETWWIVLWLKYLVIYLKAWSESLKSQFQRYGFGKQSGKFFTGGGDGYWIEANTSSSDSVEASSNLVSSILEWYSVLCDDSAHSESCSMLCDMLLSGFRNIGRCQLLV